MTDSSTFDFDLNSLFLHLSCSDHGRDHLSLVKESLVNINNCKKLPNQKREQATRWLAWAKQRDKMKIVNADIPPNILPSGTVGRLYDVKVFAKYGPDDDIYDSNKDIRDKVARGNCFLNLTGGEQEGNQCVIYALKKFTGGLGDDDDRDGGDNHTWMRYFTKPLEYAQKVVATKKANGEAAHLSARYIDGHHIIFAGSKNVHMAIRKKEDVELYSDDRYKVAREVAAAVLDAMDQLSQEDKHRLLSFLCYTEFTAVFEILNPEHQHVEELSHLKQPILRFITWTSRDLEPAESSSLCIWPPHVAIEVAKAMGLETVDYEVLPIAGIGDRMRSVREGYGYEGEVFYFLDESDAVIGMLKKKTIWYILARAVREKVCNSCSQKVKNPGKFHLSGSLCKIEQRMDEIQTWLGLDADTISHWKTLGTSFLKWCLHKIDSGELQMHGIADLFPVTWRKFLLENDFSDKVQATWTDD